MKKFLILLILFVVSTAVFSANNAIKMGYNLVTVSQTVVFNSAMQAGGTLTFTANAMDGGGRTPGDPFTMKLVFYNSSNQVVNTVQTAFTLSLGAPLYTFTVTATNCGNSCAGVAYVSAQFYGKDGGYWAGNYGPYIVNPSLTFEGGGNILYNPEFGTYSGNAFAQGWTSTAGWQNCALYSGSATCVIDNGASVNGGNYSATGGTTSGSSGGYVATPPPPTYSAGISTAQQARVTTAQSRVITNNGIYINQSGDNNTITVTQIGNNNLITGVGQQSATMNGNYNNVTIRQGVAGGDKNEIDLRLVGDSNTLNINQGVTSTGASVSSTNGMFQSVDVNGYSNIVTTQQTNTGGTGNHYMETTVTGNTNNVLVRQTDNGNKTMFTTISGNNNTVNAVQKDSGNHYLETTLTGNGNSVTSVQQGTTQNRASINITNAGGPGSVDLQQSGGQVYNITTTCVTAGGCAPVVVRQGN